MSRVRFQTFHNNNESSLNNEPIEMVYSIANRYHTDWGLKEMPNILKYENTTQVKRINVKQNKLPKRATFFEKLQEYHQKIPGPQYEQQSFWSEPEKEPKKLKLNSKFVEQTQRKTMTSDIMTEVKRHPKPGPAEYQVKNNIQKPTFKIESVSSQRLKQEKRINYFEDIMSQQLITPGPGAYNQMQTIVKSERIIKQNKSKSPVVHYPGPSNYSPDNPSYFTFDKKYKEKPLIKPAKILKKKQQISPGPALEQSQWTKGWMEKISKAPEFSIYYK